MFQLYSNTTVIKTQAAGTRQLSTTLRAVVTRQWLNTLFYMLYNFMILHWGRADSPSPDPTPVELVN